MFVIVLTLLVCVVGNLIGMDCSDLEKLRRNQELKEEREARKQSGQELQPKQVRFEYFESTYTEQPYTEPDYQKRLAELEARIAEFEKEREISKQQAAAMKNMRKEELRAKLKREEEELRQRREKEEQLVQELLSKSIDNAPKSAN